jgi:hypothetical protein
VSYWPVLPQEEVVVEEPRYDVSSSTAWSGSSERERGQTALRVRRASSAEKRAETYQQAPKSEDPGAASTPLASSGGGHGNRVGVGRRHSLAASAEGVSTTATAQATHVIPAAVGLT